MNIYVGNLSFDETQDSLETEFATHGEVTSVRVITDRDTGRSRGFGFVEMPNKTEADAAIAALNGKELNGRALTVNEAKPREDRGGSRGGGGGGGFGGGGGGGGGFGGGNRW
jgi:RNA recognition motif-containing protein